MKKHRITIRSSLLLKLLKLHLVELDPAKFGDHINAAKDILSTEEDIEVVEANAYINDGLIVLRCLSAGKADPWIGETRSFIEYDEQLGVVCGECGGKGSVDTGGVQPWGESIEAPCECAIAPSSQPPTDSQNADQGDRTP